MERNKKKNKKKTKIIKFFMEKMKINKNFIKNKRNSKTLQFKKNLIIDIYVTMNQTFKKAT